MFEQDDEEETVVGNKQLPQNEREVIESAVANCNEIAAAFEALLEIGPENPEKYLESIDLIKRALEECRVATESLATTVATRQAREIVEDPKTAFGGLPKL